VGEVDAAYDCVGGPTWAGCVGTVRDGGRAVSIAAFGSDVTRPGVTLGIFAASFISPRLAEAAGLIDAGKVKVVVSERLALADAARAHELIETAHVRGKIVLVP